LKIQISNYYFLSIILLVVSGCQELQELQLYNQSSELKTSSVKNDGITLEIIAAKERKKQTPMPIKQAEVFENKVDSKNIYKNISNFKNIMKDLIKTSSIESIDKIKKPRINFQNYFKPSIKIKLDITKIMYKDALNLKHPFYDNKVFNKLSNEKSVFFRDSLIESLTFPQIINALGKPDYDRKQGNILTFQYRQKECVVDFFFKDNSDRLIFYDMRKRNYLGKLSKKLCILSLNLRRIYK
tara:strand:- start:438 stop:1160 length:723 start_codon:yes stop_codon:yes gene_type:complete